MGEEVSGGAAANPWCASRPTLAAEYRNPRRDKPESVRPDAISNYSAGPDALVPKNFDADERF